MSTNFWGESATKFFYELTPDRILDSVEHASGLRCTGQISALNSMENRVYEIHFEATGPLESQVRPSVIAKFYRPGRWSKAQIEEEHQFLKELQDHEIPVVAPLTLQESDSTIYEVPGTELYLALFPRIYGRSPEELTTEQVSQVGRLLARIHQVGSVGRSRQRLTLTPASMGLSSLAQLQSLKAIAPQFATQYADLVHQIVELITPWFEGTKQIRLHGDCHMGNLIYGQWEPSRGHSADARTLFFVDFDDMMIGPPVQDIWLLAPGRDRESRDQRGAMLEAYQTMAQFDLSSLRLIEPLRTLRLIHFSAWIARRWDDPSFKKNFDFYGTPAYWADQVQGLKEQLAIITSPHSQP